MKELNVFPVKGDDDDLTGQFGIEFHDGDKGTYNGTFYQAVALVLGLDGARELFGKLGDALKVFDANSDPEGD